MSRDNGMMPYASEQEALALRQIAVENTAAQVRAQEQRQHLQHEQLDAEARARVTALANLALIILTEIQRIEIGGSNEHRTDVLPRHAGAGAPQADGRAAPAHSISSRFVDLHKRPFDRRAPR